MSRVDGTGVVRFIRGAADAPADLPDAELVRRVAEGRDEAAFRGLVGRYGGVVWAVCRRLLRNHHDAEDAFQATFLVLARKAGEIRAGAAVGSWLYGVAARVAGRVRSARRPEPAGPEPAAAAAGPLDDLTVREAEVVVHEELARLPEAYRAVLVLCCLDGLTRDEAARRLGWSVNRVKSCLEQGRERLRSRLTRRGIALGLPLLTGLLAPPAAAVPPQVADAAARHAAGVAPPPAVESLAEGVTRAMWIAKWKWAGGWAALVLTGGLALAVALRPAAEADCGRVAAVVPDDPKPPAKAAAPARKADPKPAWDVAAEYVQLVIDNKPEQALKLARPGAVTDRHVKELQVAGLKRVRVVMVLMNDARALVVTERAKLVRRPAAEAEDAHVTVTLEREDRDSPWMVQDSDVAGEGAVWREADEYLAGRFDFKPPAKPGAKPQHPSPAVGVATEFLTLALADQPADALKLVVPGTVSENKVGEIKKAGLTGTKAVAVLINEKRVEVVYERPPGAGDDKRVGHLVLMVVKGEGDGAWRVKDIDVRDEEALAPRVKLYLAGRYDK